MSAAGVHISFSDDPVQAETTKNLRSVSIKDFLVVPGFLVRVDKHRDVG